MMRGQERLRERADAGGRMCRMQTARSCVPRAKDLGQHAGVRRRGKLIEHRLRRRDRAPGHRGHEQRAALEMLEHGLDHRLGAKSLPAQAGDRAVHDEHTVRRYRTTPQNR